MLVVLVLSSCNDLFEVTDIKNNPNAPFADQISLRALTAGTLVGLGTLHEDTDTRLSYMWGGHLAGLSRQHAGFQNYTVSASTFSWQDYYNVGKNARLIQQKATAVNNKRSLGMAQVIEALVFTKMTSLYGDIPYSEAMDDVNHPTPKYDDQIAVYTVLITLCNDAYINLTSGVGSIEGDFIFGGSSGGWAKAAKTLQARLHLHKKEYALAITAAGLGMSSTGDDMLMVHGTSQQIDNNLNFDFFENSRPGDTGFSPPAYGPIFMTTDLTTGTIVTPDVAARNSKTDETPLYNHYFTYGIYGAATDLDPNTIDGMFQGNSPHPILTYYETELIVAESAARLGAAATADAAALAALNAVRSDLASGYIHGQDFSAVYGSPTYTALVAADFLAGGALNPATGPNAGRTAQQALLYEISSQKFIILMAQYEVFNELRRLQVATPVVKLPIPINFGSQYPARFIYPQNEINTNPNTPTPTPNQFAKTKIFQ